LNFDYKSHQQFITCIIIAKAYVVGCTARNIKVNISRLLVGGFKRSI